MKYLLKYGAIKNIMVSLGKDLAKVIIFSAFLTVLSVSAVAVPIGTGKITAENVNVRKDAGVTFERVLTLSKDSTVEVLSVKADASEKYWYQISLEQDGRSYTGYVLGDYVKYTPASDGKADEKGTQKSDTGEKKKKKKNKEKTGADEVAQIVVPDSIADDEVTEASDDQGLVNTEDAGSKSKKDGKKKTGDSTSSESDTQISQINASEAADAEPDDNIPAAGTAFKKGQKARIAADNVCLRNKPVSGAVLKRFKKGKKVTVLKAKKGSDDLTWYKVRVKVKGKKIKGFVRFDLLDTAFENEADDTAKEEEPASESIASYISEDAAKIAAMSDVQYDAYLTEQGFPSSYKNALIKLHATHPTWVVKAQVTGLKFSDALAAESATGLNLVSKNAIASWKSTDAGAYNRKKNVWYTFDGGSWAAASPELTAYYMDPRNFLDEQQIFQFETLEYNSYQNEAGLKKVLDNSFMSGDYTDTDGVKRSYAATFLEIGKKTRVNPYHLAVRCLQEQGTGKSESISGTVKGYENYFNYYNIGAYATGTASPTLQGLKFAKTVVAGSANYGRPWNSRYRALSGGALYLSQCYIKGSQNTLYLQKFNVCSRSLKYKHQYMTNVQAAASEAARLSKAGSNDASPYFYVPVYNDMPEKPCAKPDSDLNPNNYLSSLSVGNKKLSPEFDGDIDRYTLTVKKKVDKVNISATAVSSLSKIEGIGDVELERGENTFVITCTSQAGTKKEYTLVITRK